MAPQCLRIILVVCSNTEQILRSNVYEVLYSNAILGSFILSFDSLQYAALRTPITRDTLEITPISALITPLDLNVHKRLFALLRELVEGCECFEEVRSETAQRRIASPSRSYTASTVLLQPVQCEYAAPRIGSVRNSAAR